MKLRRWFSITIKILMIISLLVIMSDCEDLKTFIFTHLIATGIFILGTILTMKYEG